MSLRVAAEVLDELAQGLEPSRNRAMAGMFALRALIAAGRFDKDVVVAERGLAILADGGTLNLDVRGRTRSAELATTVRSEAFRALQTDRTFDS
jgi:hypothetical protein